MACASTGGQVLQLQLLCLVVPPFAFVGPSGAAIAFGHCRRRESPRQEESHCNVDGTLALQS
jgi:hypothetical protein